ncbi:glycosyltransferase family protein [Paraburkholderia rhizosphaerae]|uniref:Glycosyltransferase involved in cell wall biosynthesis n=1 Tax=Paraburkholderia rhizosphaerae TaxID=480658 RepID=A0A4R8LC39_9BURK|nr:glycosyltransferase [Paraburkholderia rhizosphaerae]TDY40503.1 glycosyltransferase involved in cell wall biosynthesis [Paraburkholderia rhizosphaerae]
MNPRQFFFAPVVLSRYNHRNGTAFPVNAASNKVMGMAAGVRSQASPSLIVSSPIVTASRRQRYFGSYVCRDQQLACTYLPAISVRGLNRVFAAFAYLAFAMRHIRRGDGVVFYNYFPEYVPVASFLRWRLGRDKVVMDLEDGPRGDEKNLRGYMNRFSLRLMSRVCSPRAIVVSRQLADVMKIDDACVVNGVSPDIEPGRPAFGARVTFLYGGSINTGTGLELFASALRTLARTRPELAARTHFVVTGFGGGDALTALAQELKPTGFTLDVRQDTGPDEYKKILARADVGLSLKLPDSELNATTFPSKVIEFASHGLLVLTTDISDIPLLFDRDTAAILPDAEAATLANQFAAIADDPKRYAPIAAAGQRRIVEQCSRRSVGRRLVEFLGVTPELSTR